MAEYSVNKGIGRNAEFRGLKSQYLFLFAGGLLSVFIVFVVMYMAGVPQWFCIAFGVAAALALVAATFRLNAKYGEHGLMKLQATRNHPRFIINRRRIAALFTKRRKETAHA
jgi:cell division protein FtsW (lipid II flippase)